MLLKLIVMSPSAASVEVHQKSRITLIYYVGFICTNIFFKTYDKVATHGSLTFLEKMLKYSKS